MGKISGAKEIARFLPVAGLFAGLIIGFAFDPTVMRVDWWFPAGGFLAGVIARFVFLRYGDA